MAGLRLSAAGTILAAGIGAVGGTAVLIGLYGFAEGGLTALAAIAAFNVGLGTGYGARTMLRARSRRAIRAKAEAAGAHTAGASIAHS
ncbi:hypothetical protein [Mongoliimonas terrestris]|uniref:hypothetical protein n=1 Tax=Mongoliimonas terrestris TaxID=1709001 RepID=UPI0011152D7C|nr:hypothetical protein [Mongoliimonas terrestris]